MQCVAAAANGSNRIALGFTIAQYQDTDLPE
jgi:hypothetical protein